MSNPSPEKIAEWREKASRKGAIVPAYFEVSPTQAFITCGKCQHKFVRNLVSNVNEPTFVCPQAGCRAKNWVPVYFRTK